MLVSKAMDCALSEAPPFGALLRQLRLAAGLSREALAERAGLSAKAIEALERGARASPRPATVSLLAAALPLEPALRADLLRAAGAAAQAAGPGRRSAQRRQLPIPPSALLGREADVGHVRRLLEPGAAEARLVTLVGPGGVGKTRLALEITLQVGRMYRDGAVFVDLAPLHDARLVPSTIARALGVREAGGRSAQDRLLEHLRERQTLLVLDNFEHLLGATPLVAELLAGCAELRVLATSRSPLRLRVEHRVAVAPLAVAEATVPLEAIAAAPAVQLFVERAQAVRPEFALTERNAADVAATCRHLDGLPLAIELAAARMGLLQPGALLRRLEHRLPLLVGGAADLPERQRTLRQTLAWSHDLLDPAAQLLFRRLAVFAGGWTLEAAEAVCGDAELPADTVLEQLGVLVDASPVRRLDEVGDEPHFGLLETIREYAWDRLKEAAEDDPIRGRHAGCYLALAERAEADLWGGAGQMRWLGRLEAEHDNLRAALAWCLDQDPARGLRLAGSLWQFWRIHGHVAEGRRWLEAALAGVGRPEPDADKALLGAAFLARDAGDLTASQTWTERSLAACWAAGDRWGLGMATLSLARQHMCRGADAAARTCLVESLAHFQAIAHHWGMAAARYHLGYLACQAGDERAARAHLEHSLADSRAGGDKRGMAHSLDYLGWLAWLAGDTTAAVRLVAESRVLGREVGLQDESSGEGLAVLLARSAGDHAGALARLRAYLRQLETAGPRLRGTTRALVWAGILAADERDFGRAARLVSAGLQLRAALGWSERLFEHRLIKAALAASRASLGEIAFGQAWAAGRALSLDQAIADALAEPPPTGAPLAQN